MEEVPGSNPGSSTDVLVAGLAETLALAGHFLGGLVAGEGCFGIVRMKETRRDGSPRLRFVFSIAMARWDRPLLEALREFLGAGSIRDLDPRKPGWQPTSQLAVNGRFSHRRVTIPFAEAFLPAMSEKRRQFERWREQFDAYERAHPTQWGLGPSICSVPDCPDPVRGQGLCRRHYYRATGY